MFLSHLRLSCTGQHDNGDSLRGANELHALSAHQGLRATEDEDDADDDVLLSTLDDAFFCKKLLTKKCFDRE